MIVLALVAMLTQQPIGPDFAGKCAEAAAKQAGVAASAVKVRGKYKGQDGRYMIDFKLDDGRVGVCRSKPDASVDEVKLEEKAPAPGR